MTHRILIVDDEVHARSRLRRFIRAHRGMEVVGECESGEQAIDAIRTLQPDLVFLDVQIRGATAFDVIRNIGAGNMPATVLVTAYEQHAVDAFDVQVADYLVKPFTRSRFERALDRGLRRASDASDATASASPSPSIEWFMLRGPGRELRLLPARTVDWIEACANYVILHVNGERHVYRDTMASVEARLDSSMFVRIHRSTIINLNAVAALEPIYAGDYEVRLKGGAVVRMSRNYREVLERLAGRAG